MVKENIIEYKAFIIYVADRIHKRCPSVDFDDLVQEAWYWLLKSIPKHNPEKGTFITYLYYVLESKLLSYCRKEISSQVFMVQAEDLDIYSNTSRFLDMDLYLDIIKVRNETGINSDLKLYWECKRRGLL